MTIWADFIELSQKVWEKYEEICAKAFPNSNLNDVE
jgi:hypothetical protein